MKKQLNIIFDFDSTLVSVEGIDELAKLKNVDHKIKIMTERLMNEGGDVEKTFKERLAIIQPKKSDLSLLADIYEQNIMENAIEIISEFSKFANIFIVSGGYLPAILPAALKLGFNEYQIFANELHFDNLGNYIQIDQNSQLWKKDGKLHIINQIKNSHPGQTILIGDGHSDLEAASATNEFICFIGVVHRQMVAQKATCVFDDMQKMGEYIKGKYAKENSLVGGNIK